jgi:hypothetical protein
MGKTSLALVLHAAAITGCAAGDAINVVGLAHQQHQRSLSLSLLDSFLMTTPKIDRCWYEMEKTEAGNRIPAILCDFNVPKHYNSTAEIRFGSCRDDVEPVCDEKAADGSCIGPFITSGKIRTKIYPDFRREEVTADEFNHTYCARADVYQDIDGSGKQTHIADAKRALLITFTSGKKSADGNENQYSVEMEEDNSQSNSSKATLIGTLIGLALVIPFVAFFLMKRRNGGTKIHDSAAKITATITEDEKGEFDDTISKDGDFEIV